MKKTMTLLIVTILTALTLIPAVSYAADVIDFSRTGSLTVTVTDKNKKPISGADVKLYKVADVVSNNGAYDIVVTDEFKNAHVDFSAEKSDLGDAALTRKLESYVVNARMSGEKVKSDADGNATWADLGLGIYFVTSTVGDKTYTKVSSFCVTIPTLNDDNYEYDVKAAPKSVKVKEEPPVPVPPPIIIQTGQLWWPVPVLGVLGLGLICFGFVIKKRRVHGER